MLAAKRAAYTGGRRTRHPAPGTTNIASELSRGPKRNVNVNIWRSARNSGIGAGPPLPWRAERAGGAAGGGPGAALTPDPLYFG